MFLNSQKKAITALQANPEAVVTAIWPARRYGAIKVTFVNGEGVTVRIDATVWFNLIDRGIIAHRPDGKVVFKEDRA